MGLWGVPVTHYFLCSIILPDRTLSKGFLGEGCLNSDVQDRSWSSLCQKCQLGHFFIPLEKGMMEGVPLYLKMNPALTGWILIGWFLFSDLVQESGERVKGRSGRETAVRDRTGKWKVTESFSFLVDAIYFTLLSSKRKKTIHTFFTPLTPKPNCHLFQPYKGFFFCFLWQDELNTMTHY